MFHKIFVFSNVLLKFTSRFTGKAYNIEETVKKCRKEIQIYVDFGVMPSPDYFLQTANYFRKKRNYENEASICELYIELIQEFSKHHKPINKKYSAKLQKITNRFETRLYKIKYLQLNDED